MKHLIRTLHIPMIFVLIILASIGCQKDVSLETGTGLPATGSLQDSLGNCTAATTTGNYQQGTPLNNANTVSIAVNVTTGGSYRVTTDTANGFSFADTGFFAAPGNYTITLRGKGTPAAAMTSTFTVRFGTSTCTFTVNVQPGTNSGSVNSSDTAWRFMQSARSFSGHVDSAMFRQQNGLNYLVIYGNPSTNDSTFYLSLLVNGSAPAGTYDSNAGTAVFEYRTADGSMVYDARQGNGSSLVVTITGYDATTRILSGTFSGNVKDNTGGSVPISNGRFTVQVQ